MKDLGGNSEGVPPLPIPNREVKPFSADGTAVTCGRVGRRHLKQLREIWAAFFISVCKRMCVGGGLGTWADGVRGGSRLIVRE